MRILHLPTLLGNHGSSMAMTERRAGHDSKSLSINASRFDFKSDIIINQRNRILKHIDLAKLFLKYRNTTDIFHFNFGRSLFDYPGKGLDLLELGMYEAPKFFSFNGSDVRQCISRTINPYTPFPDDVIETVHVMPNLRKHQRLQRILKFAEHCYVLNPDLMRFFPEGKATFLPYIKFVWYQLERQRSNVSGRRILRIVHAPSNRMIKGSEDVISIVNSLQAKYPVELILVENQTHEEAMKIYRSADLIIDQLRIGWYGGFALEAMKMGIPVACYINDADLIYIPREMRSALGEAIINVNRDNLQEKLKVILENRDLLVKYANSAYDYVNEFHNPDKLIIPVLEKYQMALDKKKHK